MCDACSSENVKYSQILDANRNVFRAVLKLFTDEELRMENGNWFHAAGPATTNHIPWHELCSRPLNQQVATYEMRCWSEGRGIHVLRKLSLCYINCVYVIMVHIGTSSSSRLVDWIGL